MLWELKMYIHNIGVEVQISSSQYASNTPYKVSEHVYLFWMICHHRGDISRSNGDKSRNGLSVKAFTVSRSIAHLKSDTSRRVKNENIEHDREIQILQTLSLQCTLLIAAWSVSGCGIVGYGKLQKSTDSTPPISTTDHVGLRGFRCCWTILQRTNESWNITLYISLSAVLKYICDVLLDHLSISILWPFILLLHYISDEYF